MIGCTMHSALDWSMAITRSLCEQVTFRSQWLVMTKGMYNAPAALNNLFTQLFRPHGGYAQTYFNNIFIHSRAENERSDVENHTFHL